MTYTNCKTKGCEHHAPKGELCRHHRGLVEDAALVAERKRKGISLRPPLRAMLVAVKKSKQPSATPKPRKLIPVAVEDVKIGNTTAQYGKVISARPFHGRGLSVKGKKWAHFAVKPLKGYKVISNGQPGYMLLTERGEVFFAAGSTVWTVR